MTSQISQFGAMGSVNQLSGFATVLTGTSTPTWIPGTYWANGSGITLEQWNGSAWITSPAPGTRYLALLVADPVANGAITLSDITNIECLTAGYSRQQVTFSAATTGYPSQCSNTGVITYTMSSTMLVPIQWIALVTAATGTTGYYLASWALPQSITVNASQSIQIGIGQLIIQDQ